MALNNFNQPGYFSLEAYDIPGIPWVQTQVIAGTVEFDFQSVTRELVVKNVGAGSVNIAFTVNGLASGNFLTLIAGESYSASIRVSKIFVNGGSTVSVIASTTGIRISDAPVLSASNGYEGVG